MKMKQPAPIHDCRAAGDRPAVGGPGPAAALAVILGAGSLVGGPAHAQSRQIPAPPQDHPIVIAGGTVHTVSGPMLEAGFVVFDEGHITGVGRGEPPAVPGAEVIGAEGLCVYPGLIATHTTLGLVETQSVTVTIDYREQGRLTPEVRAAVAINPDSDLIPVARANGILTAMVFPRGGLVSGRASTIRLDGWTWEQMAIDAEAGLVVRWPRTEPVAGRAGRAPAKSETEQRKEITENLQAIERLFDEAAAYVKAADADPEQATDLRFEAMRDVLSGRAPIFVEASSQGQIESAIAWAVRRGLRIVIVGGREADRAISPLRKHGVPVIITGLHRLPRHRHDPYDAPFALPAKLDAAGVRFAIASGSMAAHERNLSHNAATAAAYGLPRERALEAVTIEAARIIGLGASHGSLEVGKAATLIVTTGDPLQITTQTRLAFIDGRRIDLGNRHRSLYGKYRQKYRQLGLLGR
ncbi:MAG: amidohydrolase family protein [Planctomycetota bacterium]|jgi:imidazolonepropionase-like amidohydrolase